jgi:hypothetical protein
MAIDGFGLLKLLGRGSHFVIERLQTSGGPLLTADLGEEAYLRLKWSRLYILNYTNSTLHDYLAVALLQGARRVAYSRSPVSRARAAAGSVSPPRAPRVISNPA